MDDVDAPAQRQKRLARVLLVGGLAVDRALQLDDRVDAEHVLSLLVEHRGARLAQRILQRDLRAWALFPLLHVGRVRLEAHSQAR